MRYSNPAPETAATWVLYGNGAGGFAIEVVAEGYEHHVSQVGDLDGDGDVDILGKSYNWDTPRVDVWLNGGAGPVATLTPGPTATNTPESTDTPTPESTPTDTPTTEPTPTKKPAGDGGLAVWGDEYEEFELLSHTPELWLDLEVRDASGAVLFDETQDTGLRAVSTIPVGLIGVFTPTLPTTPTGEVWIYPYYHAPEGAWIGYVGASGAYTEPWSDIPLVYDIDCTPDERGFCYYATTTPEAATRAFVIARTIGALILGMVLLAGLGYAAWEIYLLLARRSKGKV
jgi:hypothetical protein